MARRFQPARFPLTRHKSLLARVCAPPVAIRLCEPLVLTGGFAYAALVKHDWAALKAEYVSTTCVYEELARKYKVHPATLRRRAGKEQWRAARKRKQDLLLAETTNRSVINQAGELAKCNEQDLMLVKELRSLVTRQMQAERLTPQDVRSLAGAIESAQRVARLALGASTEISGPPEPPQLSPEDLTDEELKVLDRILNKAGLPRKGVPTPGGSSIQ
jgi:hypothetical protein